MKAPGWQGRASWTGGALEVGVVGGAGEDEAVASELRGELGELAELQRGILTCGQALEGGLSRHMIKSRLRQGRWQRMYTGVYATFSGQPERLAVLWAAALRVGPDAALSHQTGAELARLEDRPSALIHVTLSSTRRVDAIPGIVLHESQRAAQARHPTLTPPQTRIEETVLDLTELATTVDGAAGWVTRALGRRLTTQDRLLDAVALRKRLRWRGALGELLSPDWAGVHSGLEYRYVRDVERPHGLPGGVRQARARRGRAVIYRDVLYEEYALAVELDGQAAHPAELRWNDIHRDNAAAADGVTTLRFGWLDVTRSPCLVAAQVAQVLGVRGYPGARPCSPACPVAGQAKPAGQTKPTGESRQARPTGQSRQAGQAKPTGESRQDGQAGPNRQAGPARQAKSIGEAEPVRAAKLARQIGPVRQIGPARQAEPAGQATVAGWAEHTGVGWASGGAGWTGAASGAW
jgi:hypothetical protein